MDPFSLEAEVPGGPNAARRAREFVRGALAGRISDTAVGDVSLLVTELVANGVRHGGATADSPLHLCLRGKPRAVRVEVADPGPHADGIAPRAADLAGGGGLGLQIVDRVATRWGVGDGPRTSVWFELDCR